jgi:hypothetical protein
LGDIIERWVPVYGVYSAVLEVVQSYSITAHISIVSPPPPPSIASWGKLVVKCINNKAYLF